MNAQKDLKPGLKKKAGEVLSRLSTSEREALIIKCWMSHDARWFMAVAGEFGMQVTNRLNQIAAHEVGKAECRRIVKALELPPVKSLDDLLLLQEIMIGLLGPNLLDYRVEKVGDSSAGVRVQRCFAYDNAARVGIADQMNCGIFSRVTGWLAGLDLPYEIEPKLGRCLKSRGEECLHTLTLHQSEVTNLTEPSRG